MPVGFVITSDGADISGQVRPGVRIVRGMDVGESQLTPRASTCSMVIDDAGHVAVGDELIVREPGGAAMFTGTVRDVSPGKDRNNVRNYYVQADGPIAGLVGAGSGFSSAYVLNVRVAPALAQLLVAGGISGIDVGVSARELALFYIDEDVPLWRQILTIMRTAGPRARLFELGDGRLRFRDEAAPAPARTIRGRLSGVAAGGLVSTVGDDEAGRERVVNTVALGSFVGSASGARVVGTVWGQEIRGNSLSPFGRPAFSGILTRIFNVDLAALAPLSGDVVYTFGAAPVGAGEGAANYYDDGSELTVGWTRYVAEREWPFADEIHGTRASSNSFSARFLTMASVVVRGGGQATAHSSTPTTQEAGALMVSMLVVNVSDYPATVNPPTGWTLVPGGPSASTIPSSPNPQPLQVLYLATQTADAGPPMAAVWTVNGSGEAESRRVMIPSPRAIIWVDGRSSRGLVPNETIYVVASTDEPFTDALPPQAGTDFTVDVGAIVVASIASARTPTSVTLILTAGPAGATISGLQLRGSLLTREVQVPVRAENAASVATWGPRRAQLRSWPFLDAPNAQALANEIVSYGAQPRRVWTVKLDADRDAATLAVVRETELGDVITCNVDSDLSQDGEAVRLEYLIGEGETWEMYLTLLATVAGLPPPATATVPGQPTGLVLTTFAADMLGATWNEPDSGGSPIDHYVFRYRETGASSWTTDSVSGPAYILDGLKADTTYEAQVQAHNGVGFGAWSALAMGTTGIATARLLLLSGDRLALLTGDNLRLLDQT